MHRYRSTRHLLSDFSSFKATLVAVLGRHGTAALVGPRPPTASISLVSSACVSITTNRLMAELVLTAMLEPLIVATLWYYTIYQVYLIARFPT